MNAIKLKIIKNKWQLLIILLLIFTNCKGATENRLKITEEIYKNKLDSILNEFEYAHLFLYRDKSLADSIWSKGANEKYLKNIITNSKMSKSQKFLASEILYRHSQDYPCNDLSKFLPEIYVYALELTDFHNNNNSCFHITGNAWGFMYDFDNSGLKDFSELGPHLISTGKGAIPFLEKLLTNNSPLLYEGSREATTGAILDYRVKDAAAFYIGEILNINVAYHENHQSRDQEIELLKKKLTEY